MDNSSSVCPICGWTTTDSLQELQDHLNAHSKQDLIELLVHQQQTSGATTPNVRPQLSLIASTSKGSNSKAQGNVASHEASLQQDNISTSIYSSNSNSFTSPRGSRSLTNLQHVSIKSDINQINSLGFEIEDEDPDVYDLVPVCTFSVPLADGHESGRPITLSNLRAVTYSRNDAEQDINSVEENEESCSAVIIESCAENSATSNCQSEDSRSKELVQEESDNATSQTSIIKYIIDQSGKGNEEQPGQPERWILPDGRAIPVYSSFHVLKSHNSPETIKVVPSNIDEATVNPNGEKHGTHVQLDLMTDEEIPPRGEISEYEESNTSSFVSEDSNVKIPNTGSSRLSSPILSLLVDVEPISKKKRKIKTSQSIDRTNLSHQFFCYECPIIQKFKSLFELIGHKVKVHPSLKESSHLGTSTRLPSSSFPILFEEKVLPDVDSVIQEESKSDTKAKTLKEFFCVYCTFTSNNKNSLSRHMQNEHHDKPTKPNIFECNTCGKTFQARTNLRKHLLVHKERQHVCSTCNKGFTSNFKLIEHARVHTKIYPFKCEVCEKAYRTPSLLNHHMKNVHIPESERPIKPKAEFYCGICHKVLRSKRSFICHTKVHHAKPKKCPYCCETFIRPSVLVRHIRVSHNPQFESTESKDCPVCHKRLHPNSLVKHMRIHANEKPYPCQVCGKNFRTYANLSSHSWSHTNVDKPFKCRMCPKSYLFKKTLEHHMMVHKRRTLHFVCNECGVKFTHKVNMKRHLEEHYSDKKYKCKTCGKAFQRNYYLLEHERIHSGLKPFVCNICGKASTTKSNHRAHIKIHDARGDSGSQEG